MQALPVHEKSVSANQYNRNMQMCIPQHDRRGMPSKRCASHGSTPLLRDDFRAPIHQEAPLPGSIASIAVPSSSVPQRRSAIMRSEVAALRQCWCPPWTSAGPAHYLAFQREAHPAWIAAQHQHAYAGQPLPSTPCSYPCGRCYGWVSRRAFTAESSEGSAGALLLPLPPL